MCICFRALVMTYLEHLGINYIAVSEDPCPRMMVHNRCPRALLLKENLRGTVCIHIHLGKRQLCLKKKHTHEFHHEWISAMKNLAMFLNAQYVINVCVCVFLHMLCLSEPARAEVFCRRVPPLCSVHHELYYHSSSFPECRQRDTLPTVVLSIASDPPSPMATPTIPKWTEDIDINSPGTQVLIHVYFSSSWLLLIGGELCLFCFGV